MVDIHNNQQLKDFEYNFLDQEPNIEIEKDTEIVRNDNRGNTGNGFDVIKWIYDFILTKEPIVGRYLKKYDDNFDLRYRNRYIYWIFLLISIFVDTIFALLLQVVVLFLLVVILLSVVRGVGLDEWVTTLPVW